MADRPSDGATRGALVDTRLEEPDRLTFEFDPVWLAVGGVIRYDLERVV